MRQSSYADLIDRTLDEVAEKPWQVDELKRLLHARLPEKARARRVAVAPSQPVSAVDAGDDAMWDNMPV